jgi:hypothetical protein
MSIPSSVAANAADHGGTADLQFAIGQDLQGRRIVAETRGRSGGLFVSREAALKYLALEWGRRPESVRCSNEPLALWR